MIILLDLNYTLVENSTAKRRPFIRQIEGEIYRPWLVKLLKSERVIMITARPEKYRGPTLQSIHQQTGWQPEESHFNHLNTYPAVFKAWVIDRVIFPNHGDDPSQYLALESNPKTRAAYERRGIRALPVTEGAPWRKLPV